MNISAKKLIRILLCLKLFKFCELGWSTSSTGDPNLTPYTRRKDELSLQNGCILWGSRVVVPPNLRPRIMSELHSSHAGSSRMKELARSYLWWPNLDKDLEELCNSCPDCLSHTANPFKAELHPWEWPTRPWHLIHVDYAGHVGGHYLLIIVNAHSKWVDIYHTKGTTPSETISCLQHSFAQFGLPISINSDNRSCFTSQEFKDFIQSRGLSMWLISRCLATPDIWGQANFTVITNHKPCLVSFLLQRIFLLWPLVEFRDGPSYFRAITSLCIIGPVLYLAPWML